MTDSHLHIGKFFDTYYEPLEIMDIVSEAGINGGMYSSTTSADENNRYRNVEKEITAVVQRYSPRQFIPLLWYTPPYIKEGISAETAFQNLPYGGIKLHPRSHFWNLQSKKHLDCLHKLFAYAHDHTLPVLIHTGVDSFELPSFFEQFFAPYPDAKIILAHCRPIENTMEMLYRYPNIYGDTAFLPLADYNQLCCALCSETSRAGFAKRLLLGTDFPITHYYREDPALTLKQQYTRDIRILSD